MSDSLLIRPSTSVRLVRNKDGAVLLDIRQGLCLGMTPIGVKIWDLLALHWSTDEIIHTLATECSIPQQQIVNDVRAFVADLAGNGLLLRENPIHKTTFLDWITRFAVKLRSVLHCWPRRRRKPVLLFWKSLFAILMFDLLRFSKEFSRMHDFVQHWAVAPWPAPSDAVDRVCKAVNFACVWYPKRVLCLQRSAVITCLLRSSGVPAQMVIGAQKFPFKGHAWVEVHNRAINERRDVQSIYLVWERC